MPVDQAVYDAAKVSAAKAGMLFRKWVERAIADAADLSATASAAAMQFDEDRRAGRLKSGDSVRLREPVNVPLEDA